MTTFGGFDWGDVEWLGGDIAATKLLRFVREGPNFRALCDIIDERQGAVFSVIEALLIAFNLDDAIGEQLDIVGRWLGLDRDGLTDTRYRRALRVQVQSILSSNGTAKTLIAIWAAWTDNAADHYRNIPPAEVEIGGKVSAADEYLLGIFLRRAAPGGVRLTAVGYDPANVLKCEYHAGDLVTGMGEVDYHPGDLLNEEPIAVQVYP